MKRTLFSDWGLKAGVLGRKDAPTLTLPRSAGEGARDARIFTVRRPPSAVHSGALSVIRFALALTGAFVLSACSGGADTVTNDPTSPPNAGPAYSGPAPATDDVQAFRINFWENIRTDGRCGGCHNAGGQAPTFARSDDVNEAYQQASAIVDRTTPSQSPLVLKVAGGHNCWEADPGACATILTRWITDWVGSADGGGKQIELVPPENVRDPGSSKRFPATAAEAGFQGVYDLLLEYDCWECHRSSSPTAQSPFFASDNIEEAYQAAIPKMNLNNPENSRFVVRLGKEFHNCKNACADDAEEMRAAIEAMANGIPLNAVTNTVVSKASTLYEGTIASGGSRYDRNVIALYEFQTGSGNTAYDTSGVDPAANLTLTGRVGTDFEWVGGWGVMFKSPTAKAQASTTTSRKLYQHITLTGEYSIEAWVIPGNVTQEDARIVSYSGSKTARNFTLGQQMYNYEFFARSTATDANGEPKLTTIDEEERLQAALQHVVVTFDPVRGRRIYVNGQDTGVQDAGGGELGEWDNSFALVLGNEVSNDRPWAGVVRLVAIHDRALTEEQIQQNFAAGVGQKYYLLFGVEHITGLADSYVMFEAEQYDSHGYLFTKPAFISLDPTVTPGNIALKGMRIGMNGAEPQVGQAYRLLDMTITDEGYSSTTGYPISTVGTVIPLELGPASDEFYLCFDQLGAQTDACSAFAEAVPVSPTYVSRSSDIGVRTFDSINATMAAITGVSPNNTRVKSTYTSIRQSLPAITDIQAYLSSHQTSVAQLALQYCNVMVNDQNLRDEFFDDKFPASITTAADRSAIIDPLFAKGIGVVASQPLKVDVQDKLDALIVDLCDASACTTAKRTSDVATAACGAALGSAATIVQ